MLGSIFENVIDRRQDRGCDRADRFLWAAPALDAEKLRAVIAVFLAFGRPGALHQRHLQPGIALAQARRFAFAGALVLTWTHPGPGNKVPGGGEAAHVAADFGKDHDRGEDADAWDRAQQLDQFAKGRRLGSWSRGGLKLLIDPRDLGIDCAIDVADRRLQCIILSKVTPVARSVSS